MLNAITLRNDGEEIFRALSHNWENTFEQLGFRKSELRVVKTDAGDTYFLIQELEHKLTEVLTQPYAALQARQFIPESNEIPTGAKTFSYTVLDHSGIAKVITDYSMDLPPADVVRSKVTGDIISYGASVSWSIQDLRAANFSGMPLDSDKLAAANMAVEHGLDLCAAFGNPANNVPGFLNNPNVTLVTLPTGNWSTATTDQILADLRYMQGVVANAVHHNPALTPNTLLLDETSWTLLSDKEVSANTSDSVLRRFIANSDYITDAAPWWRLNEANATLSGPRIVMYRRDPLCLKLQIPQPFEIFPAQAKNLAFVVPTHARIGGVDFKKPVTAAYSDDV